LVRRRHDGKDLSAILEQLPDWQPLGRLDVAQDPTDEAKIQELAQLYDIAYYRRRKEAAKELRMPVAGLDKLVRAQRAQNNDEQSGLPHWQVEAWPEVVSGDALLTEIEALLRRHIVLPQGAAEALALWVLHAWTMDAGDISPFLVLVSPTKRCGKTSVLIILNYLTPRSELASNISASAVFRYVDEIRPTLLIDEADSFLKDNEELRGILNSGHTRTAAYVIRNVEVSGEHKPRRFSTWAPKAIATIRSLADTLEDRSIVVTLQRKAPSAKVDRLRRRDTPEFACLRRKAARWAADNVSYLSEDPNPTIPEKLNDRAADNWRPLFAIAELAGGRWPARSREAACLLSGAGHDTALNVELLADIRVAFGDVDAIRSADLVEKLVGDPERPWSTWAKNDKPMTQRHLARLLAPFGIISQTVHCQGLPDAKGYLRAWFEEAWATYLPGQNDAFTSVAPFHPSNRPNADGMGTT
jgi:putative DNA primase/helicase